MGTTMDIFKIEVDDKFRSHGHKVTYTQVGSSIYDNNIIEKFENASRYKYWYLEGECGFTGELLGKDIKALLKDYEEEPDNAELIIENVEDEDFYRITVSF